MSPKKQKTKKIGNNKSKKIDQRSNNEQGTNQKE